MLLLIDNYDSFTYNLVHYFQVLHTEVKVVRSNLHRGLEGIIPESLVIGPGPGSPAQCGFSKKLIEKYAGQMPILGVCLGLQCIGEIFGGKVIRAVKPLHGMTSRIYHDGKSVFAGIPQGFIATRYHSLIVERSSLPPCLEISAETSDGTIMGLRHKDFPHLDGVQFHPESVMTEYGYGLLGNFLEQAEHLINKQ